MFIIYLSNNKGCCFRIFYEIKMQTIRKQQMRKAIHDYKLQEKYVQLQIPMLYKHQMYKESFQTNVMKSMNDVRNSATDVCENEAPMLKESNKSEDDKIEYVQNIKDDGEDVCDYKMSTVYEKQEYKLDDETTTSVQEKGFHEIKMPTIYKQQKYRSDDETANSKERKYLEKDVCNIRMSSLYEQHNYNKSDDETITPVQDIDETDIYEIKMPTLYKQQSFKSDDETTKSGEERKYLEDVGKDKIPTVCEQRGFKLDDEMKSFEDGIYHGEGVHEITISNVNKKLVYKSNYKTTNSVQEVKYPEKDYCQVPTANNQQSFRSGGEKTEPDKVFEFQGEDVHEVTLPAVYKQQGFRSDDEFVEEGKCEEEDVHIAKIPTVYKRQSFKSDDVTKSDQDLKFQGEGVHEITLPAVYNQQGFISDGEATKFVVEGKCGREGIHKIKIPIVYKQERYSSDDEITKSARDIKYRENDVHKIKIPTVYKQQGSDVDTGETSKSVQNAKYLQKDDTTTKSMQDVKYHENIHQMKIPTAYTQQGHNTDNNRTRSFQDVKNQDKNVHRIKPPMVYKHKSYDHIKVVQSMESQKKYDEEKSMLHKQQVYQSGNSIIKSAQDLRKHEHEKNQMHTLSRIPMKSYRTESALNVGCTMSLGCSGLRKYGTPMQNKDFGSHIHTKLLTKNYQQEQHFKNVHQEIEKYEQKTEEERLGDIAARKEQLLKNKEEIIKSKQRLELIKSKQMSRELVSPKPPVLSPNSTSSHTSSESEDQIFDGISKRNTFGKTRTSKKLKDGASNFTMRRFFDSAKEEFEQLEKLREAIENRLRIKLPDDLPASLSDGIVLCHLINQLKKGNISVIHVPSSGVPKLTMPKCQMNVDAFLDACRRAGVDKADICSAPDILEEKSPSNLCKTVAALLLVMGVVPPQVIMAKPSSPL